MVTAQQNLANLGTASRLVANQQNLDETPASDWSQDDRIYFIRSLANTIQQYPNDFDARTINNAHLILGQNFDGMALDDFINSAPDGQASLAKIFVDTIGDNFLSAVSAPANLGSAAVSLVNRVASTASNLGDAAERLSAAAASGASTANWVFPVALVGFVALLTMSAKKRVVSYTS